MAQFDMALDDLRAYRPEIDEPDDFDEFWQAQLAGAAEYPLAVSLDAVEIPLRYADVSDVWFAGHGGSRVGAWLYVPHDLDDDMPLVIEFAGYNGGRGRALEWLHWSAVGYPHLVVDSRGQGGGWRRGDTPDPGNPGEAGSRTILTSGLSSPDQHYYSRLFTDAARATLAVGEIPAVAGRRIVVSGASQGGALSLAAAALGDGVALVMPDVPFLSHFRRAVGLTDSAPYREVADYCQNYPERTEAVFHTLSYFDVANHARRIDAPALFSVGLTDLITPPSTVFAAFNHYGGDAASTVDKHIEVYPFNGHEGGGVLQLERKIAWLAAHR